MYQKQMPLGKVIIIYLGGGYGSTIACKNIDSL